jgi:hypothetical protein
MEMLLMGMGGCTAIDAVNILRKARQDLRGCEVQIEAERATEDPKVFTPDSRSLHSDWRQPQHQTHRTRHSPVSGKILLSLDHAGQNCPDDPYLRNPRSLSTLAAHHLSISPDGAEAIEGG